jgi:hypothetical protein
MDNFGVLKWVWHEIEIANFIYNLCILCKVINATNTQHFVTPTKLNN